MVESKSGNWRNFPQVGSVLFVTTSTPFSAQAEIFVLDELIKFQALSANFWVLPARRRQRKAEPSAITSGLMGHVVTPALFSFEIAWGALQMLRKRPVAIVRQIGGIFRHSGGVRNLFANLLAFPKALWLAGFVRTRGIEHIHAYWLTHTATIAMIAADLAEVTWSATGYRWDIVSKNHMRAKFGSAIFLRCADELGFNDMSQLQAAYNGNAAITMIRTGVHLPSRDSWSNKPVDTQRFVCAGAFVPKKQQELLVRAFALHLDKYPSARLELIGDGPLRPRVTKIVEELGISASVVFHGTLPLDRLRALLSERPVSVLPSIVTDTSEQEGIPVVLIEAMANGSPVVSTPTGSIDTLVLDQCGLLVKPGSIASLADGLAMVAAEPHRAEAWADCAFIRLGTEFDGEVCARKLAELILSASSTNSDQV